MSTQMIYHALELYAMKAHHLPKASGLLADTGVMGLGANMADIPPSEDADALLLVSLMMLLQALGCTTDSLESIRLFRVHNYLQLLLW